MFVLGGGTVSYERGTPLERLIQDPVLAPPCRDWRQDGVPRRGHFHDAVLTSSSCWEAAHFASKKRLLPGSGSVCAVGMPPDSSQSLSEAVAREASSPPGNHDRLPGQMGPPQDRWARLKIDGPASGQMGPPQDRQRSSSSTCLPSSWSFLTLRRTTKMRRMTRRRRSWKRRRRRRRSCVSGLGFGVQGSGFRVQGAGCRVEG